jgi:hypothetical protein
MTLGTTLSEALATFSTSRHVYEKLSWVWFEGVVADRSTNAMMQAADSSRVLYIRGVVAVLHLIVLLKASKNGTRTSRASRGRDRI